MGGNPPPHEIGIRVFIERKGVLNLSQTGLLSLAVGLLPLTPKEPQAIIFSEEEAW